MKINVVTSEREVVTFTGTFFPAVFKGTVMTSENCSDSF